ncbi:MAG: NUDIX domain-containing protein [Lachnospiraceae bacterium]|nr:NUDIX domain-containing protein [Lachnospiraceae bacterium]
MRRLFTIDLKDYGEGFKVFRRPSARAIIRRAGKLRLVYSPVEKYYKFPGGGIHDDEDRIEALVREVREEAGLAVIPESVREYGSALRRQNSDRDANTIFEQENYYYFCDVRDENIGQDLDGYEEKLGFTLRDVDIDEAIRVNDAYTSENSFNHHMIQRELRVLRMLKEEMYENT